MVRPRAAHYQAATGSPLWVATVIQTDTTVPQLLQRDGVVAFRAVDAQRILKEEFEIDCSLSSTYRLLHRLKLSWLAPRPRHPWADATAQAEFSQLLDCN